MEKGYYKTVREFVKYNSFDIPHIENGITIYIEHIQEPVYETKQVWVDYSYEELLENLRYKRQQECFDVINRGVLWYNTLTEEQRLELDKWYKEWLDVTDRYVEGIDIEAIIPKKPNWLK